MAVQMVNSCSCPKTTDVIISRFISLIDTLKTLLYIQLIEVTHSIICEGKSTVERCGGREGRRGRRPGEKWRGERVEKERQRKEVNM